MSSRCTAAAMPPEAPGRVGTRIHHTVSHICDSCVLHFGGAVFADNRRICCGHPATHPSHIDAASFNTLTLS
jgi:hypothetical protein